MNEEEEKQYIAEATATLEQYTGQKPKGWLGPWISESHVTLDLLQVMLWKRKKRKVYAVRRHSESCCTRPQRRVAPLGV